MAANPSSGSGPQVRPRSWWTARSLCFLLPIEPGQRILAVGTHPTVVATVSVLGADAVSLLAAHSAADAVDLRHVVHADGATIPLPDAAVDHVIAARVSPEQRILLRGDVARVLRPGGSAVIGIQSRRRSVRRLLAASHFEDHRMYGVHPDLDTPQHVVPLDAAERLRWYVRSAYVPTTRFEVLALSLLPASVVRPALLFSALAVTAKRRIGSAA